MLIGLFQKFLPTYLYTSVNLGHSIYNQIVNSTLFNIFVSCSQTLVLRWVKVSIAITLSATVYYPCNAIGLPLLLFVAKQIKPGDRKVKHDDPSTEGHQDRSADQPEPEMPDSYALEHIKR